MIMDYGNIEDSINELKDLSKFKIKDPVYERMLENAEYFEAKCNYLTESKNVNSKEIEENLALNTALKNYYYRKMALYSRYFINLSKNNDSPRQKSHIFIKKDY